MTPPAADVELPPSSQYCSSTLSRRQRERSVTGRAIDAWATRTSIDSRVLVNQKTLGRMERPTPSSLKGAPARVVILHEEAQEESKMDLTPLDTPSQSRRKHKPKPVAIGSKRVAKHHHGAVGRATATPFKLRRSGRYKVHDALQTQSPGSGGDADGDDGDVPGTHIERLSHWQLLRVRQLPQALGFASPWCIGEAPPGQRCRGHTPFFAPRTVLLHNCVVFVIRCAPQERVHYWAAPQLEQSAFGRALLQRIALADTPTPTHPVPTSDHAAPPKEGKSMGTTGNQASTLRALRRWLLLRRQQDQAASRLDDNSNGNLAGAANARKDTHLARARHLAADAANAWQNFSMKKVRVALVYCWLQR